ncbi:MAG TPA: hypothetical protein VM686_37900, partial [Polyangiaceae bacterium]|nr:hypothetical protein [Polyangiaceae bacterium]
TYVIGNLIEQGAQTDNSSMLGYLQEGPNAANPSDALFVVNNTFVNDLGSGTFVNVGGSASTPAIIRNNVFAGGGTVPNQATAVLENNYEGADCLIDAASFDYQLVADSPCVDTGMDPGSDADFSLVPAYHYVHPTSREARSSVGVLDIGAYELGGGDAAGAPGAGGSMAEGGSAPSDAGSPGGGAPSSSGGNGGSAAGSPPGGAPGAPPDAGDDGGCGCRSPRVPGNRSSAALLLAALALTFRRARARARGAESRRRSPSCSER